jgi:hypothetical protein
MMARTHSGLEGGIALIKDIPSGDEKLEAQVTNLI